MASILVLYNPTAGRMRVRALWPKIDAALKQAGLDFDAVATRAPGEATSLARSANGQYSKLVAIGGDGTLSEVVNGLMQRSADGVAPALGIIPMGSGDDFAKVLPPEARPGGACYDWPTAVRKIVSGQTRQFDVGRIRGGASASTGADEVRYFLNIVDIGFSAHTVRNLAGVPRFLTGYPAYLAAVFKTMVNYPALKMRIQIDDAPAWEQVTTLTAIGNGRCFGGGFWICPQAEPDDGLFDVMVARQVSRTNILRLLPRLQRGTHTSDPAVRMSRARRVVLESDEPFLVDADGELPLHPTRRLEIDILPQSLRLIV